MTTKTKTEVYFIWTSQKDSSWQWTVLRLNCWGAGKVIYVSLTSLLKNPPDIDGQRHFTTKCQDDNVPHPEQARDQDPQVGQGQLKVSPQALRRKTTEKGKMKATLHKDTRRQKMKTD